jgi:NAD(P)-dependent dehydrogenase (short-subunit alcohol dehydrogenase family)
MGMQNRPAADLEALTRTTLERFGAVHLLCNNAGVEVVRSVWESALADWEWVLEVHLWEVIHGQRVFVPVMLQQDEVFPMAVNRFQLGDHVTARVTIGDIAPGTPGTVVHVLLGVSNWYQVQFNGVHGQRYVRGDWLEPHRAALDDR